MIDCSYDPVLTPMDKFTYDQVDIATCGDPPCLGFADGLIPSVTQDTGSGGFHYDDADRNHSILYFRLDDNTLDDTDRAALNPNQCKDRIHVSIRKHAFLIQGVDDIRVEGFSMKQFQSYAVSAWDVTGVAIAGNTFQSGLSAVGLFNVSHAVVAENDVTTGAPYEWGTA